MIDILSVYSTFAIKVSQSIQSYIEEKSIVDLPYDKVFGTFTTIKRSHTPKYVPYSNTSIKSNNEYVHGCLGYWTENYRQMAPQQIIEKIITLSYDTNTQDSRKNDFARGLEEDAGAELEISLMLLPLYPVDNESGTMSGGRFNNDEYGLILQSSNRRATFLPKVFKNTSWAQIKKDLMKKAGYNIEGSEDITFYAYKTKIISVPIYETLFSKKSQILLESEVSTFYKKYYNGFIPYAYENKDDKKIIVDRGQDVRNLSSIGDVIRFSKIYDYADKRDMINRNLNYYYDFFIGDNSEYKQGAIFLLEDYFLFDKETYSERINYITDYLYKNLQNLEPQFSLGEALSVLSIVNPKKDILDKYCDIMYTRLIKMGNDLNNVFELNWHSKFLLNANVHYKIRNARKIWDVLQFLIKSIKTDLETNYLAVIYQCLSSLANMITDIPEIKNKRLEYFIKLNSRKGDYGLYFFKDMINARMDITGHIIFN